MKANIDAWWPHVEAGAEAIVITASGCGTMVKEYGHLLRHDPAYAAKAARVSQLARDISEVIAGERAAIAAKLGPADAAAKIAFHSPCSLQHGLKMNGVVESILRDAGYSLTAVPDAHLCCGSAGTYSLLKPAISHELLANKVAALESGAPAHDRHRQHRLPRAHRLRHREARAALDRADRREKWCQVRILRPRPRCRQLASADEKCVPDTIFTAGTK